MTIKWILAHTVYAIHSEQISEHGGQEGVRDDNLLLSALEAPKHLSHYKERVSIPALAATYAYRLIQNHPFMDGNKRTGYITARLFLILNGHDIFCSEEDRVIFFIKMAAGSIPEADVIQWFQENCHLKS
jgi:death-on-curing protein